MNLFIISDPHFGKYTLDSDKWLTLMKKYFTEFLIPKLKKYAKKEDKLLLLGDLFDNRNSIDMRAINIVVELFEEISKIIECHILLGNHDQRMMNDPTINSVATIRNIDNVFVYEEPTQITFGDKTALMLPWVSGKNTEKTILDRYSGKDLLFCHSDLNGCRTQVNPTRPPSKAILDIDDFSGYKRVYSGHIHIVQTIQNFTFVGSPYHLDRNDIGNKKGIFVYNTKKDDDFFIENDYSPEFKKFKLTEEKHIEKLKNELEEGKNFIDVAISNNLLVNNPKIRLEIDKLTNKHKIEKLEYIDDIVKEDDEIKEKKDYSNKSIKDISLEWVDKIKISDDTDMFTEIEIRELMKETIEECYTILQTKKGT